MRRIFRSPVIAALLLGASLAPALAEIPAAERDVLDALYASTDGPNWTNKTHWGPASTTAVCPGPTPVPGSGIGATYSDWHGVVCGVIGGVDHVVAITLGDNNLSGPLPALSDLSELRNFYVFSTNGTSSLTSLPPDLDQMRSLLNFSVAGNGPGLTGTIPSLAALTKLITFRVNHNGLTGGVPSLAGLDNLEIFWAQSNALDGTLAPDLFGAGLPALVEFRVDSNQLTGTLPATLNQSTGLVDFRANTNQISGSIPSLTGLSALRYFLVHENQLSGPIPSLANLGALEAFSAGYNQLSGPIPPLSGQGLDALARFRVHNNHLTGTMPDLAGLNLTAFMVGNNQLTGSPPAAPTTLAAADSSLCANNLDQPYPDDPDWDDATGSTPWWQPCADAAAATGVTAVPTLSQWALILLGLMVASLAVLRRGGRV